MRTKLRLVFSAINLLLAASSPLRADQVEMRNGDRYLGKVLTMSDDTIVLQSEMLGKINVPRKNVTSLSFGTSVMPVKPVANVTRIATAPPSTPASALTNTNLDLSSALHSLGTNTNFVRQIRDQMLNAAGPEANKKYDELINGLATGQLNLNDIRSQAKSSADQLRAYKRELGPEAGEALDMYLEVLDNFLQRSGSEPVTAPPQKSPDR